jgi:Ca-activated chloride channel family protein
MIHLAHPFLLLVGGLLLLPYLLRPQRAWHYSSLELLKGGKKGDIAVLLTSAVTFSALVLLLIALARPQGAVEQKNHVWEVQDILLTLDVSLSMEGKIFSERDGKNLSKLELIQRASLEFVQRHPHDRLGLIAFGDDAFGVWPLSIDSTMLQQRLQHLHTLLPSELRGTHIEKALRQSLAHFQELGQAQTRLLLLLTDGLDTIDPAAAEQIITQLREQHITLYLLGFELKEDTSIVRLTRQANGRYFEINKGEELEKAFQEIDQLERSRIEVIREMEIKELYALFALPGLVLLLLSTALKQTWALEI